MKFELTRITIPRQRRVARALKILSDDKTFLKSLHADTRAALLAAVAIGDRLDITHEVSPLVVDTVTDSVIGSFEGVLTMFERIASDRVVRPSSEVLEKKADATALRQLAFPKGAQFMLDLEMAEQHKAMAALVTVLTADKVAVAGVKRLGLDWAVAQVVAHLEPYGRAVRASDGRDLVADSEAFHEAFTALALDAATHHRGDDAVHKALFDAYDVALAEQQQETRARRKRNAAKPAEEDK